MAEDELDPDMHDVHYEHEARARGKLYHKHTNRLDVEEFNMSGHRGCGHGGGRAGPGHFDPEITRILQFEQPAI